MTIHRAVSEIEFTRPSLICPQTRLWSAHDGQASEIEVTDFLYALVRLLKPEVVVETGCYLGLSSLKIARALKRNRRGCLFTCDVDSSHVRALGDESRRRNLPIQAVCETGVELIGRLTKIELAFIDSGLQRQEEVYCLVPRLTRLGLIAVHDTAPHHAPGYERLIPPSLEYVYMNTPRGLTLLQHRSSLVEIAAEIKSETAIQISAGGELRNAKL